MRISDWSSDVCSSDLLAEGPGPVTPRARARVRKLRSSADEAPYILLRSVRVMDVAVAVETFKRFGLGEMMFAHITRHHAPRPFRSEAVEAKAVRALLPKIAEDYEAGGGHVRLGRPPIFVAGRSEEHTYDTKSLMSLSYAVF